MAAKVTAIILLEVYTKMMNKMGKTGSLHIAGQTVNSMVIKAV